MSTHDEGDRGDESGHDIVRPSGWKAAWEATQDDVAPSAEIKAAAETLVWCELLQQSMGWLFLTQIGVMLLGSFGQVMPQGVSLLSWGIFTLEACLKYGRSWAHNHYFKDVPCAYVPIHQEAAHNSLAFFGIFVLVANLLEISLYVPYIFAAIRFWHSSQICYDKDSDCPDGTTRLIEMLIVSVIVTALHWLTSLGTVLAFKAAMGIGISALVKKQRIVLTQRNQNLRFRALQRFSTQRTDSDRLLCLTWWVHMARHRHLSAVVASAQPADCGLPGHWFESVHQLKRIVEESDVGDHVHLDPSGPLWVSQEMALRSLISLAKQPNEQISREIVSDDGFLLLVQIVREGKREMCRGLAAAAIAVLASQPTVLEEEKVDLTAAVVPLKRLARSSNVEHVEVAYGALLNSALNEDQCKNVMSMLLSGDGLAIGEDESGSNFLSTIIEHAHKSPTTRCQELAVSLLSCLVGESKQARSAIITTSDGQLDGVRLCTALLKHGLTAQIQSGAAGVLAELAYREGQALGIGPYSESCFQALVEGLEREISVAYASARALCSLAYNNQENKLRIVRAGAIKLLVDILRDQDSSSVQTRASFSFDKRRHAQFQRMKTSRVSLEALHEGDIGFSLVDGFPSGRDTGRLQLQDKLRSDASRALRILALNNPEHQMRIVEQGAVPLLINLLASTNPRVHVQVIAALSAIAWKNRTIQDLIGECEGKFFRRMLKVLVTSSDGYEDLAGVILEKVSLAIRSLVEGNEMNRQTLLKLDAKEKMEEVISRKDQLGNRKGIKNAIKALEILDKEQG